LNKEAKNFLDIKDNLKEELDLPFNFDIYFETTNGARKVEKWNDITISLRGDPEILLIQEGQSNWDDTEFMRITPPSIIHVHLTQGSNSKDFTIATSDEECMLDVLDEIYTQYPALKGSVLMDFNHLPFSLDTNIQDITLPGSQLETVISTNHQYRDADLNRVLNDLAAEAGVTQEELVQKRFPSLTPTPTQ